MNGYDYPEAAQQQTVSKIAQAVAERRHSILDENAEALDVLASLLIDLENRLSPIMRPEFDTPEGGGAGHPEPPASTARIQLNELRSQAQRVKSILDRLEV